MGGGRSTTSRRRRFGEILAVAGALVLLAWASRHTERAAARTNDILVLVNRSNPVRSLDHNELRQIFQTTRMTWPTGEKILPFNLPKSDPLRRTFDQTVLQMRPKRVERFWIDRKIRGGNPPPRRLSTASLVVTMVARKQNAIGYVRSRRTPSAVKIVARIRGARILPP